jgi:hypothetical protein
MIPEEIARIEAAARRQNDADFAAGRMPSRYVENIDVLIRVAAIMTEHEAQEGVDRARPA